jgi:polysaccharide biosynthesis/export protein
VAALALVTANAMVTATAVELAGSASRRADEIRGAGPDQEAGSEPAMACADGSAGAHTAETAAAYTLGAGDVLRVMVFQHPDLSMEIRIHDSGLATFPLLGTLELAGLTVAQAEQRMEQGLRSGGFLRQPQVSITVTQVRAHLVSVIGHVGRPGRFAVDAPGMKLSELLAQAGGTTPSAADVITLYGRRAGQPCRLQVDVAALVGHGMAPQDPTVLGGDTVLVDRAPLVYVYGEVQRPGAMRLERGMTVLQALAAGGGPTLRGTTRGLKLVRRTSDGAPLTTRPSMDAVLRAGDVLHVPESLF